MNENKLYFNQIEIEKTTNGYTVKPNFNCPKCNINVPAINKTFTKNVSSTLTPILSEKEMLIQQLLKTGLKTEEILTQKNVETASDSINFNQQVTFTMPCCGTNITLYVAVYKSEKDANPQTCISVEPIPTNWYSRLE
ncbi:MAG: hypothetical protein NWE98_02145 [Candidatus Bathyarchaeota archaeon]|nr:hypothetical protein [Candidatus Bathyarchaeota archaeon]